MAHLREEVHDGEQRWMPWIGLALVLPAVMVLLVGVFGLISSSQLAIGGQGASPGVVGVVAGGITFVCTVVALMLGLVGLIRGLRRRTPHNGRSVGLAGLTLEIGLVVAATVALVLLGFILI